MCAVSRPGDIFLYYNCTIYQYKCIIDYVFFYENLYWLFGCNLPEVEGLIKNLPNLESIKFSILQWHTKCLVTKVCRVL